MSTPLAKAIAESGALDLGMVTELLRWKLPVELPENGKMQKDPQLAVEAIQEALESSDQVEIREVGLDILKKYLEYQKQGKLHVVMEEEEADLDCTFGRTRRRKVNEFSPNYIYEGDYIIPWQSESISDVLTNGETYLVDSRRKVYFTEVRECFFGEVKAFVICTPRGKVDGK